VFLTNLLNIEIIPREKAGRVVQRLTFLGTGTSHGVPVIGCDCPVCSSPDPRNQRTRSSILVEWEGRNILIDTATELRLQALRANLRRVDAILFTHSHADHICGLDDVRRFNDLQRASIPCYGTQETVDNLARQFWYAFAQTQMGGGKPRLELIPISPHRPLDVLGLPVVPVPVKHGDIQVLGYRFGSLAYVTDVSEVPEESVALLQGLDLLVLDALRWRPHPTHLSVEEALALVGRVGPRRTLFTHICHDLDHELANKALPPNVALAYDGLVVELPSVEGADGVVHRSFTAEPGRPSHGA
jgi:phosphoribosyl 1,2-cyclic phosphate phosphodiesterase